jgi:hypothetical protein
MAVYSSGRVESSSEFINQAGHLVLIIWSPGPGQIRDKNVPYLLVSDGTEPGWTASQST